MTRPRKRYSALPVRPTPGVFQQFDMCYAQRAACRHVFPPRSSEALASCVQHAPMKVGPMPVPTARAAPMRSMTGATIVDCLECIGEGAVDQWPTAISVSGGAGRDPPRGRETTVAGITASPMCWATCRSGSGREAQELLLLTKTPRKELRLRERALVPLPERYLCLLDDRIDPRLMGPVRRRSISATS
jgi:hypothetical protein